MAVSIRCQPAGIQGMAALFKLPHRRPVGAPPEKPALYSHRQGDLGEHLRPDKGSDLNRLRRPSVGMHTKEKRPAESPPAVIPHFGNRVT
ncbi:MAG: hypothetical protein K2Q23_01010 [Bryobacteraceae bacterium]|nr:hypothetical protein [Bryobacteraceae bacterium]